MKRNRKRDTLAKGGVQASVHTVLWHLSYSVDLGPNHVKRGSGLTLSIYRVENILRDISDFSKHSLKQTMTSWFLI